MKSLITINFLSSLKCFNFNSILLISFTLNNLFLSSNKIFLESNPIINSSCMIRKKDAIWFDRFKGLDDFDMWNRLAYENKKFYGKLLFCFTILFSIRTFSFETVNTHIFTVRIIVLVF